MSIRLPQQSMPGREEAVAALIVHTPGATRLRLCFVPLFSVSWQPAVSSTAHHSPCPWPPFSQPHHLFFTT